MSMVLKLLITLRELGGSIAITASIIMHFWCKISSRSSYRTTEVSALASIFLYRRVFALQQSMLLTKLYVGITVYVGRVLDYFLESLKVKVSSSILMA